MILILKILVWYLKMPVKQSVSYLGDCQGDYPKNSDARWQLIRSETLFALYILLHTVYKNISKVRKKNTITLIVLQIWTLIHVF